MTRTILRSVFVLALAAMAASGVMAKEHTPAGSFLNYRATTVQELSDQVSTDAKARARYTKHYGVGEQQLLQYFKQDLELVSLKSALKVETWYVSTDGSMHKKTKLLPKGTLVFATKEGKPVLQWSCGNPLSTSLPQPMVRVIEEKKTGPLTKVAGSSEVASSGGEGDTTTAAQTTEVAAITPETKVLAAPIETIAAAAVTVPPGFVETVVPAVAGAAPVAAIPAVEAVALPPVAAVPAIGGGGFSLGWLGGLAGLAGAAALAGGGGGGGNPTPPVPEPTTLIALGYGLVTVTAAAIRRRRSH